MGRGGGRGRVVVIRAATRTWRGRLRCLALGSVVCIALLTTSGVAAGTGGTSPSTVKVTGGWHGTFTIKNPRDKLQCAVLRGKGYYEIVLQEVKRVHTQAGSQTEALASLYMQGPAGTSRLPERTVADAGFEASSNIWRTRPDDAVTTQNGSGTLKISANGRSGSLNARLIAEAFPKRASPAPVHVTAPGDCTSKIQKAPAG